MGFEFPILCQRSFHLFPVRDLSTGDISDNLSLFIEFGFDPDDDEVVSSVFAHIFDVSFPIFAFFDRFPHLTEGCFGHVGMTVDIVGSAEEFLFGIPGHFTKLFVGVGDDAVTVGLRNHYPSVERHLFIDGFRFDDRCTCQGIFDNFRHG